MSALIVMTLLLGDVNPPLKRLDQNNTLAEVKIGLGAGSLRFRGPDIEVHYGGQDYAWLEYEQTATGVRCATKGLEWKDVWRSGIYVSFFNVKALSPGSERPLDVGPYRLRCDPQAWACGGTAAFVGLVPGSADPALHAAVLEWLKSEQALPAPVFEAPRSKNQREQSEIFFDSSVGEAEARQFAFLLRPLIGPVEPKPWPGGAMPAPHQVMVIVGKQRVPEPAAPKPPAADAAKVTVLRGAVTPATTEKLRAFITSHTLDGCAYLADATFTCPSYYGAVSGKWSLEGTKFMSNRWSWWRSFTASHLSDEVMLGTLQSSEYNKPDVSAAWTCEAKACTRSIAPAIKVLAAADHPSLVALRATRFDELKEPGADLVTPLFFAPAAEGSRLSITYSAMYRSHALAIAERLAPVLGPIPVIKGEVEAPNDIVLDLGK